MKTVRDACELQPNALSIKLSDQVERPVHACSFETADVAAFNGRNNPDHFFRGEIASQLGRLKVLLKKP